MHGSIGCNGTNSTHAIAVTRRSAEYCDCFDVQCSAVQTCQKEVVQWLLSVAAVISLTDLNGSNQPETDFQMPTSALQRLLLLMAAG